MEGKRLITLVQERRALYDPSDPNRLNRPAIAALWQDIAIRMKSTGKFDSFYLPIGLL